MYKDYYVDIINKQDNIAIGIALGEAIKDNAIIPETYDALCRLAKSKGFSFKHIEFVKDKK